VMVWSGIFWSILEASCRAFFCSSSCIWWISFSTASRMSLLMLMLCFWSSSFCWGVILPVTVSVALIRYYRIGVMVGGLY